MSVSAHVDVPGELPSLFNRMIADREFAEALLDSALGVSAGSPWSGRHAEIDLGHYRFQAGSERGRRGTLRPFAAA